MVLDHGNALIFQRKFFLPTVKARPSVRQISSLLISKEKSHDSNFTRLRQLSPTIGRFFRLVDHAVHSAQDEKDRRRLLHKAFALAMFVFSRRSI
jgi:hypothetical protein